jgi:outer membrane protein OmpA-like peptidoglycan-associated protein
MTRQIPTPHRAAAALLLLSALAMLGGCASTLENVPDHKGSLAVNLGPTVNSPQDDFAPAMMHDRLLFTSSRPTIEGYIQGDDMWFTDRERGGWTQALNLGGKFNSTGDEGAVFITQDGQTVFFVQCWTEDGLGDCDIYTATVDSYGKWQNIRNLGTEVNSKAWDSHPCMSPDGEYLYFSSDRSGGEGGADLWRCKRLKTGKWGKAQNLGNLINTSGNEKSPMMAPNGIDLFFSSDGHPGVGGYDLFMSKEVKNKWQTPVNLGTPFNTSANELFFGLSAREDTVFIASARPDGRGGLDLYSVAPNPFKDTTRYTYWVAGVVYDTVTTMGIGGAVLQVTPKRGAVFTIRTDKSGRFKFRTEPGDMFEVAASATDYIPTGAQINVPSRLEYSEYRKRIGLAPILREKPPEERKPEVPVAYFDFDKSDVRAEDREMLERLVTEEFTPLLEKSPDAEIELDAHTDDTGSEEYNISLSRRRGAAVSKVLTRAGVPLSSVRINAYGKARPIAPNDTEENRQLNRRVEVHIQTP